MTVVLVGGNGGGGGGGGDSITGFTVPLPVFFAESSLVAECCIVVTVTTFSALIVNHSAKLLVPGIVGLKKIQGLMDKRKWMNLFTGFTSTCWHHWMLAGFIMYARYFAWCFGDFLFLLFQLPMVDDCLLGVIIFSLDWGFSHSKL